jgi:hypothetical protein
VKIPWKIKHQFPWIEELVPGNEDYLYCRVRRLSEESLAFPASPTREITLVYRAMFYRLADGQTVADGIADVGTPPTYVLLHDLMERAFTIYKEQKR